MNVFISQFLFPVLVVLVGAGVMGGVKIAKDARKERLEVEARAQAERVTQAALINTRLDRQDLLLKDIQKELKPNSGSTLRDSTNRTEQKVDLLTSRFDDHLTVSEREMNRVQGYMDRHE